MARPSSWIKWALLLREGDIGREAKAAGGEEEEGRVREGRGGDPRVYL